MHDFLVKRLSDLGFSPEMEFQAVRHDPLMPIVASGRGLTVTSDAVVAARFPGAVYRPLDGETLSFSAIWSSTNDNPAFRRLLSLARLLANRPAGAPGRT